jgi:hypothetical protein
MIRHPFASLLPALAIASGCPTTVPRAPVPEAEPQSIEDLKDDEPPPLSPAVCAAKNTDPALARCKWTVGTSFYCGKSAPTPEQELPQPTCICNGCWNDADCGEGARCREFQAYGCLTVARACVRPNDACFDEKACGFSCLHDGTGKVHCVRRFAPE